LELKASRKNSHLGHEYVLAKPDLAGNGEYFPMTLADIFSQSHLISRV
jgi:hypothetical protein